LRDLRPKASIFDQAFDLKPPQPGRLPPKPANALLAVANYRYERAFFLSAR
jgi:hypothetical protein